MSSIQISEGDLSLLGTPHVCMHVCTYVYMYACMYVCACMYCMYACMHACMYVCMYIHGALCPLHILLYRAFPKKAIRTRSSAQRLVQLPCRILVHPPILIPVGAGFPPKLVVLVHDLSGIAVSLPHPYNHFLPWLCRCKNKKSYKKK